MRQMGRTFFFCCFLVAFCVTIGLCEEDPAPDPDQEALKIVETIPNIPEEPYRIGPSDILRIITWKEPDFSGEVLVGIDGRITFPLIGEVAAAERTLLEVKNEIENRLKAFLESPLVTVSIKSPASKKFYILGEVRRSGQYDLVKTLTLLQAFALAGGFTEWASRNDIVLIRKEDARQKIIRNRYDTIVKGKDFSQNIPILPNDTIIVP